MFHIMVWQKEKHKSLRKQLPKLLEVGYRMKNPGMVTMIRKLGITGRVLCLQLIVDKKEIDGQCVY